MSTSQPGFRVMMSIALGLALAVCMPVVCIAQDGVGVENGGNLQANANNGQGQTHEGVRHVPICDLLERAATAPTGAPGQPYPPGEKDTFIGHEPWIATLICEYISRANGKPPAFENYDRRREFVAMVLEAIQHNTGLNTAAVARDRILVGKELYVMRTGIFNGREARGALRLRSRIDIVRSKDDPNIMLLGMPYERFVVKDADKLGGGEIKDLKPAIKAAELAIIGLYALAEGNRLMSERGADELKPEFGQELEDKIKNFVEHQHLANHDKTPHFEALRFGDKNSANQKPEGWDKKEEAERERANKLSQKLANARAQALGNPATGLNLQFDVVQTPDPQAPGLTRIVYQPLPVLSGPRDQHSWYVQFVALTKNATDAEGVTSPADSLEWEAAQTILDPDRLFDETTPAPIRTVLKVQAFCIVRILYHARPQNARITTDQIHAHEEEHYRGIRDAWNHSIATLENALPQFTNTLNRSLNLNGDAAFQVLPVESRTDVLAIEALPAEGETARDQFFAEFLAVPTGPISLKEHVRLAHSFPLIHKLRFRIVRQTTATQSNSEPLSGTALKEAVTATKAPDPKKLDKLGEKAAKLWKHWKKDVFEPAVLFDFERRMIIASLQLDAAQGMIDEKAGRFVGRPEAAGLLRDFQRKTDHDPAKRPRDILEGR